MGEVIRPPLVSCDNCGKQAPKEMRRGEKEWKKPFTWGHIRVAPTYWGNYPNNIDLLDLCPDCTKAVHVAVSKALDEAKHTQHKDQTDERE